MASASASASLSSVASTASSSENEDSKFAPVQSVAKDETSLEALAAIARANPFEEIQSESNDDEKKQPEKLTVREQAMVNHIHGELEILKEEVRQSKLWTRVAYAAIATAGFAAGYAMKECPPCEKGWWPW